MRITIPTPTLGKGLLLLWLMLLALPADATIVNDLYEAEVLATGEDTASRNLAITQAMGRVMVRLTGRDPAPGAAALSEQASRYVQQYRYRRDLTADGQPQLWLWVRFDKASLDRAMRERGLPVWGSSRPGMLVWLAAEQAGRRELVAADDPLAQRVRNAASDRGLPLQWPLLDLEDQARLTAADLWSGYEPAVTQASSRYAQALVLTGRLRQVATDHWEGRWTLFEGEQTQALNSSGPDAASAIGAAIGQLADQLGARYAPAGGDKGAAPVRLKITGVRGLGDYARVLQLVAEREVVEQVLLRSADADSLLLDVQARGGRDALAQVLDLARGLVRLPDPLPPLSPQPIAAPPAPPQPAGAAQTPSPAAASLPIEPQPVPQPIDLLYRLDS